MLEHESKRGWKHLPKVNKDIVHFYFPESRESLKLAASGWSMIYNNDDVAKLRIDKGQFSINTNLYNYYVSDLGDLWMPNFYYPQNATIINKSNILPPFSILVFSKTLGSSLCFYFSYNTQTKTHTLILQGKQTISTFLMRILLFPEFAYYFHSPNEFTEPEYMCHSDGKDIHYPYPSSLFDFEMESKLTPRPKALKEYLRQKGVTYSCSNSISVEDTKYYRTYLMKVPSNGQVVKYYQGSPQEGFLGCMPLSNPFTKNSVFSTNFSEIYNEDGNLYVSFTDKKYICPFLIAEL